VLAIEFAPAATARALGEGTFQSDFDKALAGTMDGRDPDAQSFGDLFIGGRFRRLEQDVGPCHFACGGFALLDQIKERGLLGVGQINEIFIGHGSLQVWRRAYLEENLPVKISVVIY
jgi:hypothetical protein